MRATTNPPAAERTTIKRLLVVDDDDGFREALRIALSNAGYDVVCARNGVEALQILKDEAVDVLIIDILMPEKDGLETLRDFRRMNRPIPVIAITGGGHFDADLYANSARVLGAHVTLIKPFPLEEILQALQGLRV